RKKFCNGHTDEESRTAHPSPTCPHAVLQTTPSSQSSTRPLRAFVPQSLRPFFCCQCPKDDHRTNCRAPDQSLTPSGPFSPFFPHFRSFSPWRLLPHSPPAPNPAISQRSEESPRRPPFIWPPRTTSE